MTAKQDAVPSVKPPHLISDHLLRRTIAHLLELAGELGNDSARYQRVRALFQELIDLRNGKDRNDES